MKDKINAGSLLAHCRWDKATSKQKKVQIDLMNKARLAKKKARKLSPVSLA